MTLLTRESIRLDCRAADRFDAVRQCGGALVEAGYVDRPYVDAMLERETTLSTHLGEGFVSPATEAMRQILCDTAGEFLAESNLTAVA